MHILRRQIPIVVLAFLTTLTFLAPPDALAVDGCEVVDLNGNGKVDKDDLNQINSNLGIDSPRLDLDGSGEVDNADYAIMESFDGSCPAGCLADIDGDHTVSGFDRQLLEDGYGLDCRADLNRDGQICPRDVRVLRAYLGSATPLSDSAARADLDKDGDVDRDDQAILEGLSFTNCHTDVNRDGHVNTTDLAYLLADWGDCPGPAPLVNKGDPENTCDVVGSGG